jgi:phytol kinase
MSRNDIIGLLLSYVYAFGLLLIVEGIGKRLCWTMDFTRKIIHIGAGMWVWGILYFFDHWYYGIIPFGTFILLNYAFYRQQTFKQMDDAQSTPGTVYFAFSITVLMSLLWRTGGALDRAPIAIAAIMGMTWGDAFASLVGKRWGKNRYEVFGHARSWQGSAAMAVFTFASVALTLWLLPVSALSPNSIPLSFGNVLFLTSLATGVATLSEALSPAGTDNLSVPLLTGLALFICSL